MLKHFTIFIISFFAFLMPLPAFAQVNDGVIGTILELEGSASVTPAGGQASAAAINMPVHLNDMVQTETGSRVFILFIDNTELTLSENTQAKIDNYIFDPDDNTNNKASYSVMQGAFQYVSGLIGKKTNPDVHIDTPVGSIGIRGTDFWGGTLDNQYNVAVNEGQVALKTDAGESVVNKGEGSSVQDRHSLPAPASAWSPEKFQRIASTVHLRRQALVRQKIGLMQGRQRFLQHRYKKYMAQQRSLNRKHGAHRNNKRKRINWQQERRARQQHQEENKGN
jgi:hypothetical protein